MNAINEVPGEILRFLHEPTPEGWLHAATADLPILLNDHANCEKKAAATALGLLFRYPGDQALCNRMSRLAREELRHYEQVLKLMRRLDIAYRPLSASRYAQGLHSAMRGDEPGRRVDTLIIGAYIEARSCERFALLVPLLDADLSRFYAGLLASEARHFRHYLELAELSAPGSIDGRVAEIGALEARLATEPDRLLRFHSGPPAESAQISKNFSAAL